MVSKACLDLSRNHNAECGPARTPRRASVQACICCVALLANRTTIGCTSRLASACLSTRRGRVKWVSASLNPRGTRLRGPSGSLRCSIYRGVIKLVAALLRQPMTLFPDKSALLARVNGTNPGCTLHYPSTDRSHAPAWERLSGRSASNRSCSPPQSPSQSGSTQF